MALLCHGSFPHPFAKFLYHFISPLFIANIVPIVVGFWFHHLQSTSTNNIIQIPLNTRLSYKIHQQAWHAMAHGQWTQPRWKAVVTFSISAQFSWWQLSVVSTYTMYIIHAYKIRLYIWVGQSCTLKGCLNQAGLLQKYLSQLLRSQLNPPKMNYCTSGRSPEVLSLLRCHWYNCACSS